MVTKIKMHKFGQFIYVGGRKCRVCKAPNNRMSCEVCDYLISRGLGCGHPNGTGRCVETVPYNGYLKKL